MKYTSFSSTFTARLHSTSNWQSKKYFNFQNHNSKSPKSTKLHFAYYIPIRKSSQIYERKLLKSQLTNIPYSTMLYQYYPSNTRYRISVGKKGKKKVNEFDRNSIWRLKSMDPPVKRGCPIGTHREHMIEGTAVPGDNGGSLVVVKNGTGQRGCRTTGKAKTRHVLRSK